MNILTKIAIVLLAVTVPFACAIFIRMATVVPNYRQAFESAEARISLVEQQANIHQLAAQRAMEDRARALEEQRVGSDAAQKQIAGLQEQLAAEKVKNAGLDQKLAGVEQTLTKLQNDLTVAQSQAKAAGDARDVERKEVVRLREENNQLTSSVQDGQSKISSLTLAIKALEEKVAQRDEMIVSLQEKLKGGGEGASVPAGGASVAAGAEGSTELKLTGAVTGVDKDVVSVNLGSAKGVKNGMVLVIFRGDQFIAHLRVQQVDANECAGVVFDKQGQVAQGDKVATSAALKS